ncbi:cyclic-di-AMP receptor [bacterium]|nr:cyclic-di-AMP receptor [bacterium]
MKLLISIIQQEDMRELLDQLLSKGFKVTKLKSIGGFLEVSNVVLLMAVEDGKVNECLDIIKEHAHSRDRYVETLPFNLIEGISGFSLPVKVTVGGAQVFILDIEKMIKF